MSSFTKKPSIFQPAEAKMLTVGLTGGYGTGKSTVLEAFKSRGARVLSSDEIVHRELKENRRLKAGLKKAFGFKVFRGTEVERGLLAKKVFSSRDDLKKLGALVHPVVKKRILEAMGRRTGKVFVVEVPLLFEAGFDRLFDATVAVAASRKIAERRLLKKMKTTQADIRRRTAAQGALAEKVRRCDFVIDNNGSLKETGRQVQRLMEMFKQIKKVK